MTIHLITAAGDMFASDAKRRSMYTRILGRGADVVTFTEAEKDRTYIAALCKRYGYGVAFAVENVVCWKRSTFKPGGSVHHAQVMTGGKHGPLSRVPGVSRLARRGPNRYGLVVNLTDKTGQAWSFCQHHAIAKAYTTYPWRRALWAQGWRNFVALCNRTATGLQVRTGDWNRPGAIDPGAGMREVGTGPTYGRMRYDRIHTASSVKATALVHFATPLDHKAVSVRLAPAGAPTPPRVPPTPPPATPPPKEPPVTTFTDHLAAILKAEVGYHEGRSGGHWNNVEKYDDQVPGLGWVDNEQVGQAWCAVFAAWGYMKAGLKLGVDFPVTASCDIGGAWYKARKRWSEYPAVGAQVFFGTPRDLSHTGIVIAYDANTITTVEGNTNASGAREGDGVYLKKHQRREARVIGYGYPFMPGDINSADPAWRKRPSTPAAPKPPTKPTLPHNHVTEGLALIKAGRATIRRGVAELRLARGKGNTARPAVQKMADEYATKEAALGGVKGPTS